MLAPAENLTLETAVARHLAHLRAQGYTPATVDSRAWLLGGFRAWAEERGASFLADVTPPLVARYQRHLAQHRKTDGQQLTSRTQRTRLVPLRTFGRWAEREKLVAENPVAELVMPRVGQPLPKAWLSAAETETILALPRVNEPTGLRDRALLETLYSTGLRRLEALRLTAADVDFAGGAVSVRQGKGRKDRVIPIGERALAWLNKYLTEARPKLARAGDPADCATGPLFVTERGTPFTTKHLSALVTGYVARSGVGKSGSCHLFRHTCATLMLEHGADIRHVQEHLGHACLQTTQIYTHVSIRKLKEVHAATHPGAKLAPRPPPEAAP